MTSTQAAICASIFIGFFVLWFLWAAVGDKLICWIGGKNNLSGWVQAFGSILAIVAAIFISNNESRANKKQKEKEKLDRISAYSYVFKKVQDFFKFAEDSLNSYGNASFYFKDWEHPKDRFNEDEMLYLIGLLEKIDFDIFNDVLAGKYLMELKLSARELSDVIIHRSKLKDDELRAVYDYENYTMSDAEYSDHIDGLFKMVEISCEYLQNVSA